MSTRKMIEAQLAGVNKRDFLSVLDFDATELERCVDLAAALKCERPLGLRASSASALAGLHVALLFDKPSLRTWATFDIAIRELGGATVTLPADVALGAREPVADVARNLERWVVAAVIRTFAQTTVVEFALAAPRLHVINALTDGEHPCQALADFLTLREHWGGWRGRTLAFVGDGNNVATSLAHAAALLGVHFNIASPDGYELPQRVVDDCRSVVQQGAEIRLFADPAEAVRGAHAVYTDVWTSMGQEEESEQRRRAFAAYQVNAELMRQAGEGALFMHCLPAKRGEEVAADVLESRTSIVFDQAENRLHAQKALLLMLLVGNPRR
jgi:ornithine carbamoyltransferase